MPDSTPARPGSTAVRFSGRDAAAALAVVLIWGLNFVAMKLALRGFTPFQLGFFRYVFAALPLVLLVPRPALGWRWLVASGLAQFGQFALLFLALQIGMTAALASVLMQTQVFFTALLGLALLGERLGRPLQLALLLAVAGLGCFGVSALHGAAGIGLAAIALNLGAAAMWAVSNIVARRAQASSPGFDALQFVVWQSLVPLVPFALLGGWLEPAEVRWRWLDAGPVEWIAVASLGWIATITAYALWTSLLKRHPANRVAPFSLGVPVVGLAAGTLVLGERVTTWQLAGSALVVAALGVVVIGGRRRR